MTNDEIEQVDYYSPTGEVIGHCSRAEADAKNYTYPNAIVFVFTEDNMVWIQKRSLTKKHYAGLWDTSACGAIAHGEDPKLAAERELLEEMGIKCDLVLAERFINKFPGEGKQIERCRMSYIYVGISQKVPTGNHEVEMVAKFDIFELIKESRVHSDDFIPSFGLELQKAIRAYENLKIS